ncbi:hypothetical protein ACWDSJ_06150 [Nocardia sp. NPDC003482]
MGNPIALDWQTYYDAADRCHTLASEIADVLRGLLSTLEECERMAGDSRETVEWSKAYDRHAEDVISTWMTLCNALAKYGDALAATGFNYGTSNHSKPPLPSLQGAIFSGREYHIIPSATGDNGPGVDTFDQLVKALGKIPNGDRDKLAKAATAWTAAAGHDGIHSAADKIQAIKELFDHGHPNVDDILRNLETLRTGASGIAQGALAFGPPVSDFNAALGEMRSQVAVEVEETVKALAASVAVAVALSIFTAGVSAVAEAGGIAVIVADAVNVIRNTISVSRLMKVTGVVSGVATAAVATQAFKDVPDMAIRSGLAAIAAITVKMADLSDSGSDDSHAGGAAMPAPNQAVTDKMTQMLANGIHPNYDCSEIAEDLEEAADGEGEIIRVDPPDGKPSLSVREQEHSTEYMYHEVYTDGNYVYDPRLSPQPVPKTEWERQMLGDNPGAKVRTVR